MPGKKPLVVIGPPKIAQILTGGEGAALKAIIDKLLLQGVKLELQYAEMSEASTLDAETSSA